MKLLTNIEIPELKNKLNLDNRILFVGSCFASEIGMLMRENGFEVQINPFGVLYNPASLCSSFARLSSAEPFCEEDVICSQGRYTSFFHHSSFSRESREEFLPNANEALTRDAAFFEAADVCVVTLGTAWVFRHIERDYIVSNCHKIHPKEFVRERLGVDEIVEMFGEVVSRHPGKQWIFTVSPIRHLKDGAHGNQLSKATLLLAVEQLCAKYANIYYFPAYEIMMDELRDYRFYAPNMTHPSPQAVEYIFERFRDCAIDPAALPKMTEALKQLKASRHISK